MTAEAHAGPPAAEAAARPLAGRTVVVTRPREQAAALAEPLEDLGADVLLAPAIRIVPRPLGDAGRRVVAELSSYRLVVFTSVNGVRAFVNLLTGLGTPAAALEESTVAAMGPATAEALEACGIRCNVLPSDFVAEGLLEALSHAGVAPAGVRVLIPRAAEARDVLPDTLRARGAVVDVLPLYDTLPAERLEVPPARLESADFITFTSSSTVRRFAGLMEAAAGPGATRTLAQRLANVALCSIGPVTSATLRELGLPVAVEAGEYTTAGLVEAIAAAARATA